MGIFGGMWTSISLFNMISFSKDNVHRSLLANSGQQCTSHITRKFKRRVRNGKRSHRTAYMVDVEFTTMRSVSMSGRLRNECTIAQEVEILHEVWNGASIGDQVEMCYYPPIPTICRPHPVQKIHSCLKCAVIMWITSLGPPLGFLFIYFLASDITSLAIYIAIVLTFLILWYRGNFDTLHEGEEVASSAGEQPISHDEESDARPAPSVHTFAEGTAVVIGQAVDIVPAVAPCRIVDEGWRDLTDVQRAAATTLGYNQKTWNGNKHVKVDDMYWAELSNHEREAATVLGYSQVTWDED